MEAFFQLNLINIKCPNHIQYQNYPKILNFMYFNGFHIINKYTLIKTTIRQNRRFEHLVQISFWRFLI